MSVVAAHLNDAGITVLDAERILYREPGFALLDDDRLTTGNQAYAAARVKPRRIQHHYWSDLVATPLADKRFAHLSAADLASRQLEQMWRPLKSAYDKVILVVPPYMNTDNLGLLLGIASELDLPVIAMVDSAVAATRREYKSGVPVHIDMSLHSTSLTRLTQNGKAQIERVAFELRANLRYYLAHSPYRRARRAEVPQDDLLRAVEEARALMVRHMVSAFAEH